MGRLGVGLAATALATTAAAFVWQGSQMTSQPDGFREVRIEVDGRERAFLAPRSADPGSPVVVLLHGGSQRKERLFAPNAGGTQAWPAIAEREGAILLVPDGTPARRGLQWNDLRPGRGDPDVDDVVFVHAMLDWSAAEFGHDESNVFVTGSSNGGMMTQTLLIEAPERFAAGVAWISALPTDVDLPQPASATPILLFNGTEDPLVRFEGGPVAFTRGQAMSFEDNVAWWVEAFAAEVTATEFIDLDPTDGCRIEMTRYEGDASVEAYVAEGMGHAMPSIAYPLRDTRVVRDLIGPTCDEVEGAELAWTFFHRHMR